MNPPRVRSLTTIVPLLALLATVVLAMMAAMDAGLSLCAGNDVHGEVAGREVTICPVVLGLIAASAVLSAGTIVLLWRDSQRGLTRRALLQTLAHQSLDRTVGVLTLSGGIALASMIVCDGDGLPSLPTCVLLAVSLVVGSALAATMSIAVAHVALALARRVVVVMMACIARVRTAGSAGMTHVRVFLAPLEGASLLATGRGLRAPPSPVR